MRMGSDNASLSNSDGGGGGGGDFVPRLFSRKKAIAQFKSQLFYEKMKPRELIAWVLFSFMLMTTVVHSSYYGISPAASSNQDQFCYPIHRTSISAPNSNSNPVWHGGNPNSWETTNDEKIPTGSCWCGNDDGYCMCTPSLSTDIILRDSEDPSKVYLVIRKDTGQHATIGGFVNVGETVEDAMIRELLEETGIELDFQSRKSHLHLLGVYSDPRRDKRRSNVAVVYVAIVPKGSVPKAGDDAKSVVMVSIHDVPSFEMFADHKYVLGDYAKAYGLIDDPDSLAATVKERPMHRTACSSTL